MTTNFCLIKVKIIKVNMYSLIVLIGVVFGKLQGIKNR